MKTIKRLVGIAVIALTVLAFLYYWQAHPELFEQLKTVKPIVFIGLIGLYGLVLGSLTIQYDAMLKLAKSKLPIQENFLVTMYSAIVNFFGPLQSGPGFRAVYLKKRHQVSLRLYTKANLIYYAMFGSLSVIFLLVGAAWWLLTLAIFGLVIGGLVFHLLVKPDWSIKLLIFLGLATCLQLILTTLIYKTELSAVGAVVTVKQAVVYTGAANLALFVSLTPGALGFRESFLLLSQNLHHIDSQYIIAANVLDRAIYIIFLGILFLIILALHAKDKLIVKSD